MPVQWYWVTTFFYGNGFIKLLRSVVEEGEKNGRVTVFGYYVNEPERLDVVAFDEAEFHSGHIRNLFFHNNHVSAVRCPDPELPAWR